MQHGHGVAASVVLTVAAAGWYTVAAALASYRVAGHFMMAAGHGLEADLRCMLESDVPLSRLSRMSGRHIYRERGTPTARSGGEPERGGEPMRSSVATRSLPSAYEKDGCENPRSGTSQVSI